MTRKRYIKLIMAMGPSRDTANKAARCCQKHRIPYATDLENLRKIRKAISQAVADEMERAILYGTGSNPLGMFCNPIDLDFCPPKTWLDYKPRFLPDCRILPTMGLVKIVAPIREETHLPQLYKLDEKDDREPAAQWTKENPRLLDALDALRYAAQAAADYYPQRGGREE